MVIVAPSNCRQMVYGVTAMVIVAPSDCRQMVYGVTAMVIVAPSNCRQMVIWSNGNGNSSPVKLSSNGYME